MSKLIVFESSDGREMIVTTPDGEKETVKEYFASYAGRNPEEYTRYEVKTVVSFEAGGIRKDGLYREKETSFIYIEKK